MESPLEIWTSLGLFLFSVIGYLPSLPGVQGGGVPTNTVSAVETAGTGGMLFGGFISLLALGLLAAATIYFLRRNRVERPRPPLSDDQTMAFYR